MGHQLATGRGMIVRAWFDALSLYEDTVDQMAHEENANRLFAKAMTSRRR